MKVKEFWHKDQLNSEIKEVEFTQVSSELVQIKSLYSLVSTGTERIIAMGRVPESLKEIMRVPYMEGNFNFPVKYGYSLVGKVIKGNPQLIGKTVHLMHPHQDYAFVNESFLFVVPETIPARRAVLISNLETALNAIWESNISIGDRILVCGFGLIGALIAVLASQIPSTVVIIHETNPNRKKMASAMGFETFENNAVNPYEFDLAFNASGSGEALQLCIDTTMPQSRIIEVSWYASDQVTISLGESFHTGQKQIISSQVSTIPVDKQSHYTLLRRKQVILNLLRNEIFDQLPFHQIGFGGLPELFSQLRDQSYTHFATIIKY